MKLHELNALPEAKANKRLGRGPASGTGKTAGHGEKDKKQEVVYLFLLGSKVVKHHFIEEFLKEDLITRDLKQNLLASI